MSTNTGARTVAPARPMTGTPADPSSGVTRATLYALVERRFRSSTDVPAQFFPAEAPAIARACHAMAGRFERGGRLLVFGEGAEATDAAHVSVEFVHPVLVGKRALPAIALTTDAAALTGRQRDGDDGFAGSLRTLGRACDIALAICRGSPSRALRAGLAGARECGMLTLLLAGPASAAAGQGPPVARDDGVVDFAFHVPSADPLVVQEVQETLYHVMWELVHVFFETGASSS